ncbi:DUF2510 domain-containing protein [Demequina sp.]|uniref:DUF2510 domain-containing protein n=1 Tax=Demequina sp. TaxID=2050685 RepID=UPI0025BDF7A0|nr:DUF2510 domain-containing protein [Demequina sp.]
MSAAPGWYDDPSQQGNLRYWDGQRWTEHTHVKPAPAPTPQAYAAAPFAQVSEPRRAPGTGAIVGIVAAGVVLLGLIAGGIIYSLSGPSDEPGEVDLAVISPIATPTDEPADEPAVSDAPTEPLADREVPDGYVQFDHPDVGVSFVVPQGWTDKSAEMAEGMGDEPVVTVGETVTLVGAWFPRSPAGEGSEAVIVLHSQLDFDVSPELYAQNTRRGFEQTSGDVEWSEATSYVNSQGEEVTMFTATPVETSFMVRTDIYLVGEGRSNVFVECMEYVESDRCAGIDEMIDSLTVN